MPRFYSLLSRTDGARTVSCRHQGRLPWRHASVKSHQAFRRTVRRTCEPYVAWSARKTRMSAKQDSDFRRRADYLRARKALDRWLVRSLTVSWSDKALQLTGPRMTSPAIAERRPEISPDERKR